MTDQNNRPQPSAEAVAVWREAKRRYDACPFADCDAPDEAAAAVIVSALEAARCEALEQAARAAYDRLHPKNPESDWTEFAKQRAIAAMLASSAIRALKENPNAG